MAGRAVEGNAPWTKVEVVYPIVRDAIDFRMERRHFRVERGDGVGWRDARRVPIAQLSVKLDGLRVRQVRLGMPYGIIAAHWVPHSRAARSAKASNRRFPAVGSTPPPWTRHPMVSVYRCATNSQPSLRLLLPSTMHAMIPDRGRGRPSCHHRYFQNEDMLAP